MSLDNDSIALAHETSLNPASPLTSHESIIRVVKDCASNHLEKLISNLFENAQSILLAEKMLASVSNNGSRVQQNYIKEMQTFSHHQTQLKECFNAELIKRCDDSLNPVQLTSYRNTKASTLNEATDLLLSVQGEYLEEAVTITNLIAKGHKLYKDQLSTIEKRFSLIASGNHLNKFSLPFGPEHLCNAFKNALQLEKPSSELILIVYSLFDNHIIQKLDDTYSQLNLIMCDAGILPKLLVEPGTDPYVHFLGADHDTNIVKSVEQTPQIKIKNNSNQPDGDLFGTLHHFVMMKKHMTSKNKINTELSDKNYVNKQNIHVESKNKSDFTSLELIKYLNEIQQNDPNHYRLDKTAIIEKINQRSYLQTKILSKIINSVDESTIELICMLFDSIRQDTSVPANMKKTLARLKLPVIKLSLSDKSFFNHADNSARKLINLFAHSSICWNEMHDIKEDPLYKIIENLIDQIVNDAHNNSQIFSQLANELNNFLDENNTTNSPPNASSKVDNTIADSEIKKCTAEYDVPETISTFLYGTWKDVLAHIRCNFGETSLTWQYALSVTSKLVSSTQPQVTEKDKQNLLVDIPIIVNGLQDGLTLISCNREKMQQFFDELELVHMASLKGELIDVYDLTSDDEESVTPSEISNQTNSLISPELISPEKMIEEIEAITSRMDNKKFIANNDSDLYLDTVKKLTIGTWIEFTEKNNKKFRVKLVWKSNTTGEFSFADRNDNIVTEKTLSELVIDFKNGYIQVINNTPLIDRALDNIRLQLKKFVYKHNNQAGLSKT